MKNGLNGFSKWLTSTKFQIAVLAIVLTYLAQVFFKLEPQAAVKVIKDIALGYFGARILEPVVEHAVNKLGGIPGYKVFKAKKLQGQGEEK